MKNSNSKPKYTSYLIIAFLAFIVIGITYSFVQPDRIVYVDSGKILSEYKGAQEAKMKIEAKDQTWKVNVDTLEQEIQQGIRDYERGLSKMNQKQQQDARQLLNIKRKQMVEYQRAAQDNAARDNSKIMESVILKINSFLMEYGKSKNYKMILIANQSGTIAYAQEGLDVTADVIKELNKSYSSK